MTKHDPEEPVQHIYGIWWESDQNPHAAGHCCLHSAFESAAACALLLKYTLEEDHTSVNVQIEKLEVYE